MTSFFQLGDFTARSLPIGLVLVAIAAAFKTSRGWARFSSLMFILGAMGPGALGAVLALASPSHAFRTSDVAALIGIWSLTYAPVVLGIGYVLEKLWAPDVRRGIPFVATYLAWVLTVWTTLVDATLSVGCATAG